MSLYQHSARTPESLPTDTMIDTGHIPYLMKDNQVLKNYLIAKYSVVLDMEHCTLKITPSHGKSTKHVYPSNTPY